MKPNLYIIFLFGFYIISIFAQDKQRLYSLDDCINEALNHHPNISVYQNKIFQKEEKVQFSKANFLPQVKAIAGYDYLSSVPQAKKQYLGQSNNDYQADLNLKQPIFTGGKLTSENQSNKYALESTKQGYQVARNEIVYNVKTAYYKVAHAQDILKGKAELLKYAQMSFDIASALHKKRKVPREETLLRLEVQLNEIRQEVFSAQEELAISKAILRNTVGMNDDEIVDIKDLNTEVDFNSEIDIEVSKDPRMIKLVNDLKEADEKIKIAKSSYWPQINAHLNYGQEWAHLNERKADWLVGLTLEFDIFDWGKTKAEVGQARAYRMELQAYQKLANRQIDLELQSARLKYKSAYNKFTIAKNSIVKAKKSLDLFENRYRDTLVTSIELLDAQKAFSQAQTTYATSLFNMRTAKAEIEKYLETRI